MSNLAYGSNENAEALALLYSAAIDNINRALQPTFGEGVIDHAVAEEVSPAAIALRIVSVSCNLFAAWCERTTLADTAASRELFANLIRTGFHKGVEDRQQLQWSAMPPGSAVAGQVERACELVNQGLTDFATVEWSQPGGPMPEPDPI